MALPRRTFRLAIGLLLVSCGTCPRNAMLLGGVYLREDYVSKLQQTRSPYQSQNAGEPQFVEVKVQNATRHIVAGNMHEGWAYLVQRANGSIEADTSTVPAPSNLTTSVSDVHHLRLGFERYKPSTYIFAGNLDPYISALALAGDYTDSRGRRYVFDVDGWASFPDRRFQYVIAVDHIPSYGRDYFTDRTSGKDFVFEKRGDLLRIFATKEEDFGIIGPEPLYELRSPKQ